MFLKLARQKLPQLILPLLILMASTVSASERISVSARFRSGVGIKVRIQVKNVGHRVLAATSASRSKVLRIYRSRNDAHFKLIHRVRNFSHKRYEVQDSPTRAGHYSYRAALGTRTRVLAQASSRSISVKRKDLVEGDPSNGSGSEGVPPPGSVEQDTPLPAGVSLCPPDHVSLSFQRINYHRNLSGLAALNYNSTLAAAALEHAGIMASTQVFSHDGWFQEIWKRGIHEGHMSQNIANYIRDPVEVVDALMTSLGHMHNILYPSDSRIGIGCVIDQNGKYWWAFDQAS